MVKKKKEELAGWLGDATLGESPSFGNDDYMADLDAANIYYLMQEKNYPIKRDGINTTKRLKLIIRVLICSRCIQILSM